MLIAGLTLMAMIWIEPSYAAELVNSEKSEPTLKVRAADKVRYQTKDGSEWSGLLLDRDGNPLLLTNGCAYDSMSLDRSPRCKPSKPIDATSDAMKACMDLGMSLPSRSDYQNLMKEFGHVETEFGVLLTAGGESNFRSTFSADGASSLWTSTIYTEASQTHAKNGEWANWITPGTRVDFMREVSNGKKDSRKESYFVSRRDFRMSVMCIRKPTS